MTTITLFLNKKQMKKLKVIVVFTDKETRVKHGIGETIERNENRALELISKGVVELIEVKKTKTKKNEI